MTDADPRDRCKWCGGRRSGFDVLPGSVPGLHCGFRECVRALEKQRHQETIREQWLDDSDSEARRAVRAPDPTRRATVRRTAVHAALAASAEPGNFVEVAGDDEVERLRAEVEDLLEAEVKRLRAILRAVVEWSEDTWHVPAICYMCDQAGDRTDLHDQECPVLHASRALEREDGGE